MIQDSGFSTETSSSKEAHSASSTTGPAGGAAAGVIVTVASASSTASASVSASAATMMATIRQTAHLASAVAGTQQADDADDELWNLLDVIHRKSMRLRDEVDRLQSQKQQQQLTPQQQQQHQQQPQHQRLQSGKSAAPSTPSSRNTTNHSSGSSDGAGDGNASHRSGGVAAMFQEHCDRLSREDVQLLRRERDKLLEKLFQMEGEALADRLQAGRLHDDLEALQLVKRDLEQQLQLALSQKSELNSRIQDMHATDEAAGAQHQHQHHQPHQKQPAVDPGDMFASATGAQPQITAAAATATSTVHSAQRPPSFVGNDAEAAALLGRLDGVISVPVGSRSARGRTVDSKKFEAILLETNIAELQRHLLNIIMHNQVRDRERLLSCTVRFAFDVFCFFVFFLMRCFVSLVTPLKRGLWECNCGADAVISVRNYAVYMYVAVRICGEETLCKCE